MTEEQNELVDLLRINVEMGKCSFYCEDCHRFFECLSPRRQEFYQRSRIKAITQNLSNVKHIITVMSGKGGVGKSTISANLAFALANREHSVAIMDSDLYGPSIPNLLGVGDERLKIGPRGVVPPQATLGIKVVSIDYLLSDDGLITWSSEQKRSAQELFLANTDYGYLDYLIIDVPSGTGSETINLFKYLPQISGAIVVTTPSDIAEQVVRRCISLCQKAKIPIIGLIENMSSLTCPQCGKTYMVEHSSADALAGEAGAPLLGRIAWNSQIVDAADKGLSFLMASPDSEASKNFYHIVTRIEQRVESNRQISTVEPRQEPDESELLEIVEINAGHSCFRKNCYSCTEYFRCTYSKKVNLYEDSIFRRINERMSGIKHKIAVMSCKGGVGKSTFAANLAAALALKGRATTILDCDFHGPSIPRILGVDGTRLKIGKKGIVPALGALNIGVISTAFVIEADEAVTWFDTLKKVTVEQFLANVDYGNLDYLIIDLPPGTGAESYSLLQCIPGLDGTVIVTLPSENPQAVARRSITLCRQAKVPVIGIVENMSRFVCPNCNNIAKMCGTKNVRDLADRVGVPFLGDIPLDNNIFKSCDEGVPFVVKYPESLAAHSLLSIVDKLLGAVENRSS